MSQIIAGVTTVAWAFIVGSIAYFLVGKLSNIFLNLAVDPLAIPMVNQVILWASLGALAVCLIIRVARGVYELVLNPSDKSPTFAEWCTKTVLSVAAVVLMPLLCNVVIHVGTLMFNDVTGLVGSSGIVALNPGEITDDWLTGLYNEGFSVLGGTLVNCILVILISGATLIVIYQLLKRQIIIYYVTIISSWVAVKASMDSFDDVVDLIVNLFGMVVIQWVQYLTLAIAIIMLNNLMGEGAWVSVDIGSEEAIQSYIAVLAFVGAALGIPNVLERYAFSAGRTGAGAMIAGAAVRGGFSSFGKVGRAAGSLAGSIGKAIGK